mgnify:CR=1 FL=1
MLTQYVPVAVTYLVQRCMYQTMTMIVRVSLSIYPLENLLHTLLVPGVSYLTCNPAPVTSLLKQHVTLNVKVLYAILILWYGASIWHGVCCLVSRVREKWICSVFILTINSKSCQCITITVIFHISHNVRHPMSVHHKLNPLHSHNMIYYLSDNKVSLNSAALINR